MYKMFTNDLSSVMFSTNAKSRSITAENQNGESGKGGMKGSSLGESRKGSACKYLKQDETITLAEIEGSGIIRHIWLTVPDKTDKFFYVMRNLILRMYWDGEEEPSVEVPLGDFFCNGFGERCIFNSQPIVVAPTCGMNSYFQMPFRKGAKITVENQHPEDVWGIFYQIDYTIDEELPDNTVYFHAQWRREALTEIKKDFVIVDGIEGKGHYIGTYVGLACLERYWYGEGEVKFFIDDDAKFPTICGTGFEDYFGGAWGFRRELPDKTQEYVTFDSPYLGYHYYSITDDNATQLWPKPFLPMHGFYRWHIPDPITFEKKLKVTIQQIGCSDRGLFERQDDYSATSYWYQSEPHNKFPQILDTKARQPR